VQWQLLWQALPALLLQQQKSLAQPRVQQLPPPSGWSLQEQPLPCHRRAFLWRCHADVV